MGSNYLNYESKVRLRMCPRFEALSFRKLMGYFDKLFDFGYQWRQRGLNVIEVFHDEF